MDNSTYVLPIQSKWKEANSLDVHCSNDDFVDSFIRAARVYIEKPQVVNRRLCGAVQLASFEKLSQLRSDIRDILFQNRTIIAEKSTPFQFKNELWADCVKSKLAHPHAGARDLDDTSHFVACMTNEIILQDLLPRNTNKFPVIRQLVVLDRLGSSLVVLPLWHYKKEGIQSNSSECQDLVYEVKLCVEDGKCQLKLNVCVDPDMPPSDSSEQWLCDVILHKMAKWMEEPPLRKPNISSLQLLPIDAYNDLYQHLKEKYGRELVEKWPERTDPQKFVFEDVAIATYLLVTWERERVDLGLEKKQSFADLGCGNGLLVHILRQEGHPGFGIDVRKRNIWDMYGDSIDLREAPIIPSDTNLFSNTDWLIGNHSDELTPWIPVMAARSSYNTRFFVLPCCHHDFDSKFSGKNAGESQYRTYLDFIKTVCEVCGFDVLEDALRIPSTKRICLIGKSRSYTTSEEAMVDQRITEYIKSRCKNMVDNHCPIQLTGHSHGTPLDSDNEHAVSVNRTGDGQLQTTNTTDKLQTTNTTDKAWALSFQPRAKVEKVRNCTQLPHDLTSEVVQRVFDAVLNAEDAVLMCTEDGRNWCKGGVVPLSSIVSLLGSDILKRLKSECGGVQTLLRNHHNIFQVSGGAVRLRYDDQDGHNLQYNVPPRKKQKIKQKDLKQKPVKTKLCWFHDNHPDGCPKTREHCQFAHGAEDLNKGSQHEQN